MYLWEEKPWILEGTSSETMQQAITAYLAGMEIVPLSRKVGEGQIYQRPNSGPIALVTPPRQDPGLPMLAILGIVLLGGLK